ncbi:MAG: ribonuclease R [Bacteroidota bacterium]
MESSRTLKKTILSFLSARPGSAHSLKDLARRSGVTSRREFAELRSLADRLTGEGILERNARGELSYPPPRIRGTGARTRRSNHVEGELRVNRRGFGFVHAEGWEEDIFIAPGNIHTALHGDLVEAVLFPRGKEARFEGEVVRVLERRTASLVGALRMSRHFLFVVPDDPRIGRDIYVAAEDASGARHGDKVVVRLLPWEDEHQNPEGVVEEVLGEAGDPRVEVEGVARAHGLPARFSPEAEEEAARLDERIGPGELEGRLDLRETVSFTIDPEDAKDFDDAVSLEPRPGGLVRLGVHIADVAHYVRRGMALDEEARQRGTSVYLVDRVLPMLPERLSNDLCSLRPRSDRLTFSVLMDVNGRGTVEDYRIVRSVIHSVRRFTYEEAQEVLECGRGELAEHLLPMHELARTLGERRKKEGSLDIDTPEARFRFDADGLPSGIVKKVRQDAHRLIEEFMLLANRTVARHVGGGRRNEEVLPFIYRVHDLPDPAKMADCAAFVQHLGYSLDASGGVSSRELQKLLTRVRGTEMEDVVNQVVVRSLAKAAYSEKNIGHYGLAFRYYTHFTSPIRRYPDLAVHRMLQAYAGRVEGAGRQGAAEGLAELCRHCSERERTAMEAERDSVKVMQAEYMKRHVGDEFEGVIAGVTRYGLFVEIRDLLVEGMIRVRDLLDDYYVFDEKRYALRGRSRGRVFSLGDTVRVRVVAVQPEAREVNFALAEEAPAPATRAGIRPRSRGHGN